MAVSLNVSSVILQSYPEISPWELDLPPVGLVLPPDILPCPYFVDKIKLPALDQARKTGKNPFYFMCMSNPLLLDHPEAACNAPPLPPHGLSPPLPEIARPFSLTPMSFIGGSPPVFNVNLNGAPRALKLASTALHRYYQDRDHVLQFSIELTAYSHLIHHDACKSGAVPRCDGWIGLASQDLQLLATSPLLPEYLKDTLSGGGVLFAKALVLEDLSDAQPLSIRNISTEVADKAMRSLHQIHTAYVLHGNIRRNNIFVTRGGERVVWLGFNHASYGECIISRELLLNELAQLWSFLYEKMIPDAFIGLEDDRIGQEVWMRRMVTSPAQLQRGARPRIPSHSADAEIRKVLLSYPEINVFDWNPPLFNLTPEPKDDHLYDTPEFIAAIKQARRSEMACSPFIKWYGNCPTLLPDDDRFREEITTFDGYVRPDPLPQWASDTPMEMLECLDPFAAHPLIKVRVGNEERLMKFFSGWSTENRYSGLRGPSPRHGFETELSAYSHLSHYGACDEDVVPRCYGWITPSSLLIAMANDMIAKTVVEASKLDNPPAFISPIFSDGHPALALIIEYLPNAEVLTEENATPEIADLTLRAFARIHGCYVCHRDAWGSGNILLVKDTGPDGDHVRVVVIDFDHAQDASKGTLCGWEMLQELTSLWNLFYAYIFPEQRAIREPVAAVQDLNGV
ncbi:hypothetical protein C8Q78DRAFT_1197780 [Trametes maxima]|nr:hypothetical protein C8Q78DRAFT_1197780 [Trametes maxima]